MEQEQEAKPKRGRPRKIEAPPMPLTVTLSVGNKAETFGCLGHYVEGRFHVFMLPASSGWSRKLRYVSIDAITDLTIEEPVSYGGILGAVQPPAEMRQPAAPPPPQPPQAQFHPGGLQAIQALRSKMTEIGPVSEVTDGDGRVQVVNAGFMNP